MTPLNASSVQGLFSLRKGIPSKIKKKIALDCPKNENGLTQMIMMGKSIGHKWFYKGRSYPRLVSPSLSFMTQRNNFEPHAAWSTAGQ